MDIRKKGALSCTDVISLNGDWNIIIIYFIKGCSCLSSKCRIREAEGSVSVSKVV